MAKAVVLFDSIGWYVGTERHDADKGETVDLPEGEFKRLSELGAVASPRSKDAKEASAEPSDQG